MFIQSLLEKKFTAVDLGYFNRADLYSSYVPLTIGTVVSRVAFPIFSRIQDDNSKLRNAYSKYIIITSCVIFPIMIGLIILANPLTIVVLREQWLPMVPLLQILCIDWMFDHLNMINLNVLYVKGRSDIAFRNEIIKKSIAMLIFLASLYWGIIGVCWGRVIYGIFAIYVNSYYTKRLINLSIYTQLRDVFKPLVYSMIMGAGVFIVALMNINIIIKLLLSVFIGATIYLIILRLFSPVYFSEFKSILLKHQ